MRHLLLRHLWMRRRFVEPPIYAEITHSLKVDQVGGKLRAIWTREGVSKERIFEPSEYLLYVRGDTNDAPGSTGADRCNEEIAARFAEGALGASSAASDFPARALHPRAPMTISGAALLAAVLFLIGNPWLGLVLLTLTLFEFAGPSGKMLTAAGFAIFPVLHMPVTGALGAGTYTVLQFLDPNPRLRAARISLGLVALILNAQLLSNSAFILFDRPIAPALIAAVSLCVYARWTCGSHFRSMPLVLPILSLGMAADGAALVAMVALAGGIIAALSARYAYLATPLRDSKTAFFQTMTS